MNAYGYPTSQLFGMLSLDAYNPYNNFSYNNYYTFQNVSTPGNLFYGAPSFEGKTNCTQYSPVENYPNWLSTVNDQVDLRQVFLKCNAASGLFEQVVQWGACYNSISPISKQTVCYSTEALYYAQSGYFSTVVLIQWSNIFACKSRKVTLILILGLPRLLSLESTHALWSADWNPPVHLPIVHSRSQWSLWWQVTSNHNIDHWISSCCAQPCSSRSSCFAGKSPESSW